MGVQGTAERDDKGPQAIKVSDLLRFSHVFMEDPSGQATVQLADGEVIDEARIRQFSPIFDRTILHTLKELLPNGAHEHSLIAPKCALKLLQTLAYTRDKAREYQEAAVDIRMSLFSNAVAASLEYMGVAKETVADALNHGCDQTGLTSTAKGFTSALGRVVTHTAKFSGVPLYPQFEGRIDDHRKAEAAAEAAMTDEERRAHRIKMIKECHERVKARQAAGVVSQERSDAPVDGPALADTGHNTDQIDTGALKREAKEAMDHYKSLWNEIAVRIKPITIEALTDSKAATPFIRLTHRDFMKQFDEVLKNAKEYGLIREIDNSGAKHSKGSMIELFSALKRAHYMLDNTRREVEMFRAQDLPSH